MKIKNKIFTLLSVFTLVGLTHSLTLKDANAALSAPASWTYKYTNEDFPGYKIRSTTAVISTPSYTRTADGVYYNYTNTSTITTGLTVQQTFYRSNTSWYDNAGLYIPSDTKIGSNSSVGTLTKEYLKFNNQTSKDYYLYLDKSSNAGFLNYEFLLNGREFVNTSAGLYMHVVTSLFMRLVIPSYSTFEMTASSIINAALYSDAWYLLDLGVSDAYDAGYEQGDIDGYEDGLGNNPNVLLSGFQAMVGILVNFMLMIFNLEVFGVSIMSVFGILALFVGVIWILKIVRG
jgi:hypothetical protein